ncbi:beta-ketoacyl synthase N-terminal-like domain-containing protein [Rossellomorea sp. LjRoot5]|uniref:beta-ketoacyl synthase N-terminal-like domain-containing protein n=1 Tax=Rossellomorea sp. LjRoot5 TaxID=3342331 RepID=UPI003ECCD719
MMGGRCVLSGIGIVTPGDNMVGTRDILKKIRETESLFSFDKGECYPSKVGIVDKQLVNQSLSIPKNKQRRMDNLTKYLLLSTQFAIEDADLDVSKVTQRRFGNITGTSFGSFSVTEKFHDDINENGVEAASPLLFPNTVLNQATGQVSIQYNAKGVSTTINGAGNSGLQALSYAIDNIEMNMLDVCIVGGVDLIFPTLYKTYNHLGYLANKGNNEEFSSPFDSSKSGLILGEGSVSLIIESEEHCINRGGNPICYIDNVSCSYSLDKQISKNIMLNTLVNALETSKIEWDNIDYISSNARSDYYDDIELSIYQEMVNKCNKKSSPYITSLKSITGELNAASTLLSIADGGYSLHSNEVSPLRNFHKNENYEMLNLGGEKPEEIFTSLVVDFDPSGYNAITVLRSL